MSKIHSEKVRKGSLVCVNLNTKNPQKYADEITGYVNAILSKVKIAVKD